MDPMDQALEPFPVGVSQGFVSFVSHVFVEPVDWEAIRREAAPPRSWLNVTLQQKVMDTIRVSTTAPDEPSPAERRVWQQLFPTAAEVAAWLNSVADTSSPEQFDVFLGTLADRGKRLAWSLRSHSARLDNRLRGTLLADPHGFANMLASLSDDAIGKFTAHALRTLVSLPMFLNDNYEPARVLLTRRPDIDPNQLLANQRPAWYDEAADTACASNPTWALVLQARLPRVDPSCIGVFFGIPGTLLHALLVKGDGCVAPSYIQLLLDMGATPLTDAEATAPPLDDYLFRWILQREYEGYAYLIPLQVAPLFDAGLVLTDAQADELIERIPEEAEHIREIQRASQRTIHYMRERQHVLRAAYMTLQDNGDGVGAGAGAGAGAGDGARPRRRARHAAPPPSAVLAAFFQPEALLPAVEDHPDGESRSHAVASEYAGMVASFTGGRRRRHRR